MKTSTHHRRSISSCSSLSQEYDTRIRSGLRNEGQRGATTSPAPTRLRQSPGAAAVHCNDRYIPSRKHSLLDDAYFPPSPSDEGMTNENGAGTFES